MPSITARICGICPVSHLLASAKACDAIMAVAPPEAGASLRELVHCAQFVQSHALSFFHLSAPDLLLGFDSDPARRNIFGLIEENPERPGRASRCASSGRRLSKGWPRSGSIPPGSCPAASTPRSTPRIARAHSGGLAGRPRHGRQTLGFFKGVLDSSRRRSPTSAPRPRCTPAWWTKGGGLQWYDGRLQFKDAEGKPWPRTSSAQRLHAIISAKRRCTIPISRRRTSSRIGYPAGVYRVGPLARLNVADGFGTPDADRELAEFRQRCGTVAHSSFYYHYARLIELMHGLEKIEVLLNDPAILDTHVRAHAPVNCLEGVGMIEAPRGVLIHHYKVDERAPSRWANLIVATGHNNLAINRSVEQVARHFVDGTQLKEGMLNRVSAVVRAYDPCLSCSTHADGTLEMEVLLNGPDGTVLDSTGSVEAGNSIGFLAVASGRKHVAPSASASAPTRWRDGTAAIDGDKGWCFRGYVLKLPLRRVDITGEVCFWSRPDVHKRGHNVHCLWKSNPLKTWGFCPRWVDSHRVRSAGFVACR